MGFMATIFYLDILGEAIMNRSLVEIILTAKLGCQNTDKNMCLVIVYTIFFFLFKFNTSNCQFEIQIV